MVVCLPSRYFYISKISKTAGLISRLHYVLPGCALMTLYNSLVLPYLNYCAIIWAVNCNSKLNRIKIVQKRIIRIVTKKKRLTHSAPLFKLCNVLVIADIYKLQVAQFMYKFSNNLLPSVFDQYFVTNASVHGYNTRQSSRLHIYRVATKIRQNSIKFAGPKIWNTLPEDMISVPSLSVFTSHYKNSLLDKYY